MDTQPIELAPSPAEWRIVIAMSDLKWTLDFIAAARKHPVGTLEHEALLECAVIRYARAFTPNEKEGKNAAADSTLTLSVPLIQVLRAQEYVDLHERILKLRHTVVAHVPASQCPVTITDPFPRVPGVPGVPGVFV